MSMVPCLLQIAEVKQGKSQQQRDNQNSNGINKPQGTANGEQPQTAGNAMPSSKQTPMHDAYSQQFVNGHPNNIGYQQHGGLHMNQPINPLHAQQLQYQAGLYNQ